MLAQTVQTIDTATIMWAAGIIGAFIGATGFIMKLIDWKMTDKRPDQNAQCAIQHGVFQQEAKVVARSLERLIDSQTTLNHAVEQMASAVVTEQRIADMRHKEIMRGFEVMQSELRVVNNHLTNPDKRT